MNTASNAPIRHESNPALTTTTVAVVNTASSVVCPAVVGAPAAKTPPTATTTSSTALIRVEETTTTTSHTTTTICLPTTTTTTSTVVADLPEPVNPASTSSGFSTCLAPVSFLAAGTATTSMLSSTASAAVTTALPLTAATTSMTMPSSFAGGGHSTTTVSASSEKPGDKAKISHRPAVFDKLEQLVRDMQDDQHGVPVRSQKMFLTSIPAAFMGYDLIEWIMDRLSIEDSLEAVHLANLLCQFGYYFPVNELKNLMVKDDSSLYRFQTPYYWPSQHHTPDNIEYAIYLAKRNQRNKQKHGLEEYEVEAYNNLKKILSTRWDFVLMQAEEQLRLNKDRKKGDKIISDSQEKAYWRVYRPPPGFNTMVESSPVPTREQRLKARCRTREHLSFELVFLQNALFVSRCRIGHIFETLAEHAEVCGEFDPFLNAVTPSNPWVTDDQTFWFLNFDMVDCPTEKRVKKWAVSLEHLMMDPLGIQELMVYMKKEYSHENLRFWLAVHELRTGSGQEAKIRKKVKEIWDEFLAPGAKAEVNIDGKTMEATKQAMKNPTRFTFQVAAEHVFNLLLKKDCYPRFKRSEHFKLLVHNSVNPANQKKRFPFNFPGKKKPSNAPLPSGAGTANPCGSTKERVLSAYEEYNIYGADGAEDDEGVHTDTETAVCPWDKGGSSAPRGGSAESGGSRMAPFARSASSELRGSTPNLSSSKPALTAMRPTTATSAATPPPRVSDASVTLSPKRPSVKKRQAADTNVAGLLLTTTDTVTTTQAVLDEESVRTNRGEHRHRHGRHHRGSSRHEHEGHHHHHHRHHDESGHQRRAKSKSKRKKSSRTTSTTATSTTTTTASATTATATMSESATTATTEEGGGHNDKENVLATASAAAASAAAGGVAHPRHCRHHRHQPKTGSVSPASRKASETTLILPSGSAANSSVTSPVVSLKTSASVDLPSSELVPPATSSKCTQTKLEENITDRSVSGNASSSHPARLASPLAGGRRHISRSLELDGGGPDREAGAARSKHKTESSVATAKPPAEVCPWEDEEHKKESHEPFVKRYTTLEYL